MQIHIYLSPCEDIIWEFDSNSDFLGIIPVVGDSITLPFEHFKSGSTSDYFRVTKRAFNFINGWITLDVEPLSKIGYDFLHSLIQDVDF